MFGGFWVGAGADPGTGTGTGDVGLYWCCCCSCWFLRGEGCGVIRPLFDGADAGVDFGVDENLGAKDTRGIDSGEIAVYWFRRGYLVGVRSMMLSVEGGGCFRLRDGLLGIWFNGVPDGEGGYCIDGANVVVVFVGRGLR